MTTVTCAAVLLTACGSADDSLQPSGAPGSSVLAVPKNDGQNLIALNGDWRDWAGNDNGIRLVDERLRIPAPAAGANLVIGVQRVYQSLEVGTEYAFSVSASSNDAQMLLFLLDGSGNNLPVTPAGETAAQQWVAASNSKTVTFDAPAGVAGFYLQVQGGWQASASADLSASLAPSSGGGTSTGGGGSSGIGQPANGGFESGTLAPWENWGGFTVVSGAARNGQYAARIGSSTGGGTTVSATGGDTYVVKANGRREGNGGSLTLFAKFFDASWSQVGNQQTASSFGASWSERQVELLAPANARYLQIGFWNGAGGTGWIDDVSISTADGGTGAGSGGGSGGSGGSGGGSGSGGSGSSGDFRPAGYNTLILSDEFNGTSLDRSIWCTRLPYGSGPALQVPDEECTKFIGQGTLDYANETENQRFRDFNSWGEALHVVSNGTIKLRATRSSNRQYQPYEAAALRSKRVFKPEQGKSYYITSRVVLPDVLGIWPAFYLNPSLEPNGTGQWPPEIDIFEAAINGSPGENQYTLIQHAQVYGAQTASGRSEWTYAAPGFNTDWGFWTSSNYLRERWIEIGAEWTETGVCYFVDGFKTGCENYRWVTNNGTPGNPATVVMFLAVGGPWAGANGIDATKFPTALEVDYIRVYER